MAYEVDNIPVHVKPPPPVIYIPTWNQQWEGVGEGPLPAPIKIPNGFPTIFIIVSSFIDQVLPFDVKELVHRHNV